MAERDPIRLRDVLEGFSGPKGFGAPLDAGLLWREWRSIVGEGIADHAEPTSLRSGVLRVRTDSPAWATEIGYLADVIKTEANRFLGKEVVTSVRIWTGAPRNSLSEAHEVTSTQHPDRLPGSDSRTPRSGDQEPDPVSALERARRAWQRARTGRR